MLYISDVFALNLTTNQETCGDWHCSALNWDKPTYRESDGSFYGVYGLEPCSCVPSHPGTHLVANHVRALLDMLHDGQFSYAQGMKNDFICNDRLTPEIFLQVHKLKTTANWRSVCRFMGKEYGLQWLHYLGQIGDNDSMQLCRTRGEDL